VGSFGLNLLDLE